MLNHAAQEFAPSSGSMASGKLDEVDEAILEFFQETSVNDRIVLPPKVVWYNIVEQRGRVQRSSDNIVHRMQKLTELGLLERVDYAGGYYRLTEQGEEYVVGETRLVEILGAEEDKSRGPFSKLEWEVLTQIAKSTDGLDVKDEILAPDPTQRALNRLLNFEFVREQDGRYVVTSRGKSAIELEEVYDQFGPEEFFSRLAERERQGSD